MLNFIRIFLLFWTKLVLEYIRGKKLKNLKFNKQFKRKKKPKKECKKGIMILKMTKNINL